MKTIKIELQLPEATARAANDAGLLTADSFERLVQEALRRTKAADSLLAVANRVAAAGVAPMTMEEINAEVKAGRASRAEH